MNDTQDQGDAPDVLTEMRAALIEAAAALATVANNIRRESDGKTPVFASIACFADDAVDKARAAAVPHRLRVVDSGKARITSAADRSRAERCERC